MSRGGSESTATIPEPLDPSRRDVVDRLREARRLCCCLDYDGTLAPIVEDPDDAVVPGSTARTLERLRTAPGVTVAIVSGRSVADLRTRVPIPVTLVGNHGLERYDPSSVDRGDDPPSPANDDRGVERTAVHPLAAAAIPRMETCAAVLETVLASLPGVRVEYKGLTGTVHYRTAPDEVGPVCRRLAVDVLERMAGDAVSIGGGSQIVEFGPAIEWGKGDAVDLLRADEPDGTRVLYCGDDTTDEDAFRALRAGDVGVRVGGRQPSASTYRVDTPDALASFLARLSERRAVADGDDVDR